MKLFIWEDVLRDYTSGMIVALAPDLETAIQVCRDQYDDSYASEMAKPCTVIDLASETPPPSVWAVHGGG